jgi:hypothetical protein
MLSKITLFSALYSKFIILLETFSAVRFAHFLHANTAKNKLNWSIPFHVFIKTENCTQKWFHATNIITYEGT